MYTGEDDGQFHLAVQIAQPKMLNIKKTSASVPISIYEYIHTYPSINTYINTYQ